MHLIEIVCTLKKCLTFIIKTTNEVGKMLKRKYKSEVVPYLPKPAIYMWACGFLFDLLSFLILFIFFVMSIDFISPLISQANIRPAFSLALVIFLSVCLTLIIDVMGYNDARETYKKNPDHSMAMIFRGIGVLMLLVSLYASGKCLSENRKETELAKLQNDELYQAQLQSVQTAQENAQKSADSMDANVSLMMGNDQLEKLERKQKEVKSGSTDRSLIVLLWVCSFISGIARYAVMYHLAKRQMEANEGNDIDYHTRQKEDYAGEAQQVHKEDDPSALTTPDNIYSPKDGYVEDEPVTIKKTTVVHSSGSGPRRVDLTESSDAIGSGDNVSALPTQKVEKDNKNTGTGGVAKFPFSWLNKKDTNKG